MSFEIHFRGVGVFVAKGGGPHGGRVTDVLFPSAETTPPPNGDPGTVDAENRPLGKYMKHADNTDAPQHFAGALIVSPTRGTSYRKLNGRLVRRDTSMNGAVAGPKFFECIPNLAPLITNPSSKLTILNPGIDANHSRIATRFQLDSGSIDHGDPSKGLWLLASGIHGSGADTRSFARAVKWTIDDTYARFEVLNLDGSNPGEGPIELTEANSKIYFYSYDAALPTQGELDKDEQLPAVNLIDNDFKWSYALLDRANAKLTRWQDWLRGNPFPAPQLIAARDDGSRLVPVSTCFPLVWTGD